MGGWTGRCHTADWRYVCRYFARSSAPQLLRGRSSFLFEKVISVQLSRRHVFLGLGGTLTTGVAARAWLGGGSGSGRSPSRGRGKWTTFGSVALLGWNRQRHDTMSAAIRHGVAVGIKVGTSGRRPGEPARCLDRDRAGRGRGAQRPRPTRCCSHRAVPAAGGCRRSDRDGVRHRAATGRAAGRQHADHLGELPGAQGRGRPRRRVRRPGRRRRAGR